MKSQSWIMSPLWLLVTPNIERYSLFIILGLVILIHKFCLLMRTLSHVATRVGASWSCWGFQDFHAINVTTFSQLQWVFGSVVGTSIWEKMSHIKTMSLVCFNYSGDKMDHYPDLLALFYQCLCQLWRQRSCVLSPIQWIQEFWTHRTWNSPYKMDFSVLLGCPTHMLCSGPLALDKWSGIRAFFKIIYTGLFFNTHQMTIGVTDDYRQQVGLIDVPGIKGLIHLDLLK